MTKSGYRIVVASCYVCKSEAGPFVRIDYSTDEKNNLGEEVYCIYHGQERRDALNKLIFKVDDSQER